MKLKDKVALITGGASGIGEATVRRFAMEGAKVVIVDIDPDAADKAEVRTKEDGAEAIAVIADTSRKAEVEAMMEKTLEKFGRLDILVNNAGINRDAFVKKMTEDQWDQVINVNLKGAFLCSQAAFAHMSERKSGRIINTASIGALGNIGQANYSASKMGVIGLTKTLALEGARYNITVNCVSPGATNTPMMANVPEDVKGKIKAKIPLNRFAEPREIANVHLFLASDEASFITGQVIFVDGGMSVGF
jgi:3-oxoacyl-[acyl-carrier protein] reductase